MLDYVMKTTGQDELFYVGHSQGTVMGFAGFTFNQSLAQHIKVFFALAPVSTVKYIKGLFAFISEKLDVRLRSSTQTVHFTKLALCLFIKNNLYFVQKGPTP